MAQQSFSFPALRPKEILLCLHELQIPCLEDELQNPTSGKVQHMYGQFIELLLNQRRDDMVSPVFQALEELEFPELHEDSVPTMGFLKAW